MRLCSSLHALCLAVRVRCFHCRWRASLDPSINRAKDMEFSELEVAIILTVSSLYTHVSADRRCWCELLPADTETSIQQLRSLNTCLTGR